MRQSFGDSPPPLGGFDEALDRAGGRARSAYGRDRVCRRPAAAETRGVGTAGALRNTGWYYGNGFWRLRGLLDKLVGGVGLRRGRRDPVRLAVGDTLDFWRVEAFEKDRLLRLSGEMKTPGASGYSSRSTATKPERPCARQQSSIPTGSGRAYWYALTRSLPHLRGDAAKDRTGCDREPERLIPRSGGAGVTARPDHERSSAPRRARAWPRR